MPGKLSIGMSAHNKLCHHINLACPSRMHIGMKACAMMTSELSGSQQACTTTHHVQVCQKPDNRLRTLQRQETTLSVWHHASVRLQANTPLRHGSRRIDDAFSQVNHRLLFMRADMRAMLQTRLQVNFAPRTVLQHISLCLFDGQVVCCLLCCTQCELWSSTSAHIMSNATRNVMSFLIICSVGGWRKRSTTQSRLQEVRCAVCSQPAKMGTAALRSHGARV